MNSFEARLRTLKTVDVVNMFSGAREVRLLERSSDLSALRVVWRDDVELLVKVVFLDDLHNRACLFDVLENEWKLLSTSYAASTRCHS